MSNHPKFMIGDTLLALSIGGLVLFQHLEHLDLPLEKVPAPIQFGKWSVVSSTSATSSFAYSLYTG